MELPRQVVDRDGNTHFLRGLPLGEGGQGVVLRTSNPDIVVKLITATGGWSREELLRRIEDVRLLPIADLHLARPLALLEGPEVGYSMTLLREMVPIRTLLAPRGTTDLAAFYQASGGVRRRLELLANTAVILARLHAVPLVYADLSPNNVFVSEALEASEAWLIDLDNLDYLSAAGPRIYTPGYGAPELARSQSGATTLSDAYGFAMLAFQVLFQVHPFLGDYIEEGGWDAEDGEDREQLAFQGLLPWIEDPDDDRNRTHCGIPRDYVLTRELRGLFQRMFGPGRTDPGVRPGMAEWVDGLRRALDRVVTCGHCRATFDVPLGTCPFCRVATKPTFIHMQVNRWDPEIDETGLAPISSQAVWHKMVDILGDGRIHRRVIEPLLARSVDLPVLAIHLENSGLAIEPYDGVQIHAEQEGRKHLIDRQKRLALPVPGKEIRLHFGSVDQPHRVAFLRYHCPEHP